MFENINSPEDLINLYKTLIEDKDGKTIVPIDVKELSDSIDTMLDYDVELSVYLGEKEKKAWKTICTFCIFILDILKKEDVITIKKLKENKEN